MSAPITGRERYEWLVPIGSRKPAHAFILGAKSSICLSGERFGVGNLGFEHEVLQPGEPRRVRCGACMKILKNNRNMVEVSGP
jgi:hypothetical protein